MTISVLNKARGTKYQARLKEPGGKYHRLTFDSMEAAQRWHDLAEKAIREGRSVPDAYSTVTTSLESLVDLYAASLWPNQLLGRVTGQFEKMAAHIPLSVSQDLSKITSRELRLIAEGRRSDGVKPASIKHNLSYLRQLLGHAVEMGDIPRETFEGLQWPRLKSSETRYRFLTPEEEEVLLGALKGDHRDLAKFLIDTGCRPGEVLHTEAYAASPFKWQDVSKTPEGRTLITIWETKTGTTRTVPLTKAAADILERRRESGERSPFGAVNYRVFAATVTRVAKQVGLQDVVVYTFRHTCATRLVQRGADVRRVQVWMGHSSIETTLRYAKLVPQDIYFLADVLA